MNNEKIYLDTEAGKLLLERSNSHIDQVDVFRCTDNRAPEGLGFLLCVRPNVRTLHGRLTDDEHDVLQTFLDQDQALRDLKLYAGFVVSAAAELAQSNIQDPDAWRFTQEAAAKFGAVLDLGGFDLPLFALTPPLPIRQKSSDGSGYRYGFWPDDQGEDNPFRLTEEERRLLAVLDPEE